jgi:hypothetical protein
VECRYPGDLLPLSQEHGAQHFLWLNEFVTLSSLLSSCI